MTPSWITAVVGWFAEKFGGKLVVYTLDKIRGRLQSIFASRNILILGSEQTGKTSLILFLTTGKPYEIVKGEIKPPDKTLGYVVVDKKVSLNEGQWIKLKRDVPGEADLRSYWEMAIDEIKPTGIIYMLDGRLTGEKLENAVTEIFDEVLCHYEGSGAGLEALHVFVNFVDQWGTTPVANREKLRWISELFDKQLERYKGLQYIRVSFAATQLSPNKDAWIEVERALFAFGADLLQ
ncbi:MAG: hypothetical protein D6732_23270 [Methanobacteriota archaeon]|nr:MAG: hypothetical protein D6732_23270 [Euryarchaeota archaeon]